MTIRILGVLSLVLVILAIGEFIFIGYLVDNRATWIRLAQETHDIATMCVVQAQGDVDRLDARLSELLGLGTVEISTGEEP